MSFLINIDRKILNKMLVFKKLRVYVNNLWLNLVYFSYVKLRNLLM